MDTKVHTTAGCFLTRVFNGKTQLLLLYKCWPGKLEGWMPPKGHVENGETLEDAAKRETTEESGYKNIVIKGFLKTINIEYPWDDGFTHRKSIHWYHSELINEELIDRVLTKDENNSTVKQDWFDIDKAKDIMKFDDEKEVLEILIQQLKL